MSHPYPQDESQADRPVPDPAGPQSSTSHADHDWADLLSPRRRSLLAGAGLATAAGLTVGTPAAGFAATTHGPLLHGVVKVGSSGVLLPIKGPSASPWGNDTVAQPTARPPGIRPDEEDLPTDPLPYTRIRSYHAHIYFDEDSYRKAALIRRWTAERFPVELGDWNLEPRGPHVTPSFYFGFTPELLPIVVPWLQLNSLGLTILIHPNTGDPRSDHLHYALWVNRSQPVNAYTWKRFADGNSKDTEEINPNVVPTVALEV